MRRREDINPHHAITINQVADVLGWDYERARVTLNAIDREVNGMLLNKTVRPHTLTLATLRQHAPQWFGDENPKLLVQRIEELEERIAELEEAEQAMTRRISEVSIAEARAIRDREELRKGLADAVAHIRRIEERLAA